MSLLALLLYCGHVYTISQECMSPMTMIVVDGVVKLTLFIALSTWSVQFTLVPFKFVVTELITILDTRGNSSLLETLETLNEVEFT